MFACSTLTRIIGQDTGIDQLYREPCPRPPDLSVCKRDLDPRGFNVGDDQEYRDRGDEREHFRTHILDEIGSVNKHLDKPWEESHGILVCHRYPV